MLFLWLLRSLLSCRSIYRGKSIRRIHFFFTAFRNFSSNVQFSLAYAQKHLRLIAFCLSPLLPFSFPNGFRVEFENAFVYCNIFELEKKNAWERESNFSSFVKCELKCVSPEETKIGFFVVVVASLLCEFVGASQAARLEHTVSYVHMYGTWPCHPKMR